MIVLYKFLADSVLGVDLSAVVNGLLGACMRPHVTRKTVLSP